MHKCVVTAAKLFNVFALNQQINHSKYHNLNANLKCFSETNHRPRYMRNVARWSNLFCKINQSKLKWFAWLVYKSNDWWPIWPAKILSIFNYCLPFGSSFDHHFVCTVLSLFIQIFRFCLMINDIGQRIQTRNDSHYKIRGEENENSNFATTQSNSTLIWLIGWLGTEPNIICNSINLLIVSENDFRFSSQSAKLFRFRTWIFE